jgi:ribosomal protein S18 acetylase RimI-like enzyme
MERITEASGVSRASGSPATSAPVVRRVSPAEWAAYRQVRLAALADSPQAFSSTLERELEFDEQVWRQRLASAASFLAWQDDQAVGTVTVLLYDESDGHGFTGAAHLVAMWVSPAARRLGAGQLLVKAVFDHARAAGAPSVVLWVFEENGGARAFYERMGFRETDLRDSRPGKPEDVELMMIRYLS